MSKKALVFGGTSGIGLATCKLLLSKNIDVIAFGRSQERIEQATKQVQTHLAQLQQQQSNQQQSLGTFRAESVDILDTQALTQTFNQNKGFDYLICTATGGKRAIGPFLSMSLDGFRNSFDKLWGYTNAVRLGVPQMSSDKGGVVVLVSGSPAKKCQDGQIALSCVGGAVENLVRGLAKELASSNVRIACVSPGLIDTPMFDGLGESREDVMKVLEQKTKGNPVNRPGRAEEVAGGILFVLENEFVTGSVIDVDGGAVVA